MPRIDLTGQVFGRLTVIAYVGIKNRAAIWTCFCKCGNKIKIRTADLRRGHTKSCGCLQKDLSRKRLTKHGLWDTPSYQSWRSMKQRCTNPTNIAYKYYGGRGISFCSRWDAFENFFEDMGERPIGLTLERVDNEKGYSKENCKWANQKEQIRNSRIKKDNYNL